MAVCLAPKVDTIFKGISSQLDDLTKTTEGIPIFVDIRKNIEGLKRAIQSGDSNSVKQIYDVIRKDLTNVRKSPALNQNNRVQVNGILGGVDELVRISRGGGNVRPVKYQNETNYTFQGGNNYRETVLLDEPIVGNSNPMKA